MVIGIYVLEFHIPGVRSLKEKRRVLKSMIERVKARYNVSVAEIEKQDLWQEAVIGITMISNDKTVIDQTFSSILRLVEGHGEAELVHSTIEIL
jgi:uncharacterized protein